MKNKIKFLLPLIIVIILLFVTVNAYAEEQTVAVASSDFQTHQGETFDTTIYIPDGANIVDFDITLKYDTEKITLLNAEENEDVKGTVVFNTTIPGVININYTRTSKNVTSYLPLIDLKFDVDENIGVGTYDCFTIDQAETYIAHRLNTNGTLTTVDFNCDFSKLIIYEIGDVDLSCSVDIADATYIRRHLAQFDGAILSDFKLTLADTYSDGIVDIADSVCLQRHLAKMDVVYGNRVNITFYDGNGNKYVTKSVYYDGTLTNIPNIPEKEGSIGGSWSLSPTEYIEPQFSHLTKDVNLYVYYDSSIQTTAALEYYKQQLTDMYFSGDLPTNLSSTLNLRSELYYQSGYHAALIWSSDCNYVLNSTTGYFTKPTYPQNLGLSVKIISYDSNDRIEGEDTISFDYSVPGVYRCPTKAEIEDFLKYYFTDSTDNSYRVNYDVKLLSKINSAVLPAEGSMYENYEVRLDWYQNVDGVLTPINQIKRTTSAQTNSYVAVATFNGQPIEDDGKIYIDDVNVTAIEQMEIKNYIINQIAANQGTLATDGISLWNNDTVYGTSVTWESGNTKIGYVGNNKIELKSDAVSGSTLPLNATVSYSVNGEVHHFVLSYNLTVSCNNTIIKYPENMDEQLYKAIKMELEDKLGYRGDITSAALSDVRFVNLDLSGYPEISSLRGLSYCTNLRTLNISGLHINDGTMNQIATLSYLEAFIARGCGLDNLSDGGTATLKNAVNLYMIDLTNNNFTSLDSVFAAGIRYGKLREVYLSNNRLTDINALSRAPMMTYLSLSGNGLTTEGSAAVANYPLLTYLSLADNNIDSVEYVKGLRCLTELRLQNNQLTNVDDLRRLTNLEALYLGHNKIKDIGLLNALAKLKILYVNDNEITSISNLTNFSDLEIINVSNNQISSLSTLIPYKAKLKEVYAENNKVTDFSFINGAVNLHILMLNGNKVTLTQDNMTTWLSGLSNIEILTLSDIKLTDLSFLSSMQKIVRLDIANCGLSLFNGEISNISLIADRYATLRVLNISNNNFNGDDSELLKLRNVTLLTILYADNICSSLDINTLTYSMTELMCISLENDGITSMSWLSKFNELTYVDLAGNSITDVNLNEFISNSSHKTIKSLYLDTNVPCTFTNAFYVADFDVENLSLEGVNIGKIEKMPNLEFVKYLNISNTGLSNLTGDDLSNADLYSIERYSTIEKIDVSNNEINISPIENMDSVKTVYAVGATDSKLFYEDNLHSLQRLYNNGVNCYLYDKNTEYIPTATKEGIDILNLIDDISCDITVAADNAISDNNPLLIDEINDFDITWSVSNDVNYEVIDNHIVVKSYAGIEDEVLTVTATITVYPDQPPVSRDFTINTNILRISPDYYDIDATGYSEQLTRDSSFTYNLSLKAAETEGFGEPVKPVEDYIEYNYVAKSSAGGNIPYVNVVSVGNNHNFTITPNAPLNSVLTIQIAVKHMKKDGTTVYDMEMIEIPVTIAERTFTATFVMNGGTIVDGNNLVRESVELSEDSNIFAGLTYSKPGYRFDGWYTDSSYSTLFSSNGEGAVMPSNDLTLYAKWTALSYKVNFNANEGTVDTDSITALSNVELGTLPTPTRTYYTFDGWFTEADGGEKVTSTSKFARTEDLNLYAHWTLNSFVVTFNANGGSVSQTSLRAYCGQPLDTLPIPTKDYYTFDGWYTDISEGTEITASTSYSTAQDITAYAHWSLKPTSDWVKATDIPSDAQIVNTKWAYTLREYTTNSSSTLSGWIYDSKTRTGWGAEQGPVYSNPDNGVRSVRSESYVTSSNYETRYHYYRYAVNYTGGYGSYAQSSSYPTFYDYWFSSPLTESANYGGYKYWYSSNYITVWPCADSGSSFWVSDNYGTRWYYKDPIYTYSFHRDLSKESTSDPTGQENVSNVVMYVQYREK